VSTERIPEDSPWIGASEDDLPSFAFVVPTLNEERHIDRCLSHLLAQDYPADRVEVVVVDGGSRDATREIVTAWSTRDPRVRLLDNPRKIAPAAFNIGIAATDADVVAITSGHGETDPGFARTAVEVLRESGALLVGGRTVARPASERLTARAIARAWSSPLGMGGARHHYDDAAGWVDTAYPSAYRRELVEAVGPFDETFVRNQDDEYHLRAAQLGHRMRYDPRLRADYFPRSSLRALFRQYYDYGYWRTRTLAKHRAVASPRQLVPAIFVAGFAAGPVVWRSRPLRLLWLTGVGSYGALLGAAGARELREQAPPAEAAGTAVAVATIHLAYGAGFWAGVAGLARARRWPAVSGRRPPPPH
jgi:glycosyltransferase involved in cell wall biosynthesis